MYGQSKYGLIQYARDSDDSGNSGENLVDLSKYVPPFVAEYLEMAEIYRTEGYEAAIARYKINDLLDQCFVQTATWGLVRWEEEYGVTTNFALSYEQRREILIAKMRGQGTTTVEMIRNTAVAFAGGEVDVIEDNPNYHFIVRFIGFYGIPRNMQAFIDMLEEIKPAHLGYSLEYKYVIWDELATLIWDELKPYTWDGLRISEITPLVRWGNIEDRKWSDLMLYGWDELKSIEEAKS